MSYEWGANIKVSNTNILTIQDGLRPEKFGNFELMISSPERALLELLYQVPGNQSVEESYLIMQGLMGMRPSMMQKLLENLLWCMNRGYLVLGRSAWLVFIFEQFYIRRETEKFVAFSCSHLF